LFNSSTIRSIARALTLAGLSSDEKTTALERDGVAAGVAVLTPHAERERELAHALDEALARDVFRVELQVLALPRRLGGLRRGRRGKQQGNRQSICHKPD
jgi:hypothetical protein